MEVNAFKEDFRFLYTALSGHPLILVNARKKRSFMDLYRAKAEEVCSYESLIGAATELTVFFQDGHTNIEVPYSAQDFCIPLRCEWEEDSGCLILREKYCEIPAGAYIVDVDGITVEGLISRMTERIPHENRYLVKSRMVGYPYQNYHLFSEMNLKYLFGEKDGYDISFLANGKKIVKRCCPESYDGFLDFADDSDFIAYEIEDSKAILHLNACILNEKYKKTLETLARLCRERRIKTFILDLSRNISFVKFPAILSAVRGHLQSP